MSIMLPNGEAKKIECEFCHQELVINKEGQKLHAKCNTERIKQEDWAQSQAKAAWKKRMGYKMR